MSENGTAALPVFTTFKAKAACAPAWPLSSHSYWMWMSPLGGGTQSTEKFRKAGQGGERPSDATTVSVCGPGTLQMYSVDGDAELMNAPAFVFHVYVSVSPGSWSLAL